MSISLKKGDKIDLTKQGGLSLVRMGLGWDPVKKSGWFGGKAAAVDLDASCIMFSGSTVVDTVWFRQLESKDGSIRHSGDNRTGDGDGDDESIAVDLDRLPANVDGLAFTVNSFTGQTFDAIDNCHCRIVDEKTGKELCTYILSQKGSHTGVLMAVVKKEGSGWSFKAVGDPASGKTFESIIPDAAKQLA